MIDRNYNPKAARYQAPIANKLAGVRLFEDRWSGEPLSVVCRLASIGATIGVQCEGSCYDPAASERYFEIALPFIVEQAVLSSRATDINAVGWVNWCTPGLHAIRDRTWVIEREGHVRDEWFEHQKQTHGARPFLPDGHKLARSLSLTVEQMRKGKIRGMSPIDATPERLAEDRRVADAARKIRDRDATGCQPHETSAERLNLWKALGMGKTKFHAERKAGRMPLLPSIPRGADPAP